MCEQTSALDLVNLALGVLAVAPPEDARRTVTPEVVLRLAAAFVLLAWCYACVLRG